MDDTDKTNILLVDDRPENLLPLEALLQEPDLNIIKATSGNEALSLMLEHNFALVLLDVQMPDMDGFETAELMRSSERTKYVPIIFVTAINKEKKHVFKGYQTGAVDYLFKPLDQDILKSKVKVFLELHKQKLSLEETTNELQKTNEQLMQEITERKRVEKELHKLLEDLRNSTAQLMQAEKMSGVGTLVAGVAHELNNPLMGLLNFSAYCLRHTDTKDKRYPVLQDMERESKRCADIVQNLLTFSRKEKQGDESFQKEKFSVILDRVLKLLSYRIEKERVTLSLNISKKTPEIWMKPSSMQQVILNLGTNALDAVEKNQKKEIRIEALPRGEYVQITVSDNGTGVAPENLNSIYDPFFTTKPIGKGTGLGLSVTRSIVEMHGGKISCENNSMNGTTFKILFPLERRAKGE